MLNHLDDPHAHEFPDDFRHRVETRARALQARRRLGMIGAAAVAVVALGATGLYGRALSQVDDVERITVAGTGDPTDGERTVLLTGVDGALGARSRTDTMLVVRLAGGRASVLSIPRDLAVAAPDGGEVRVNTVVAGHGYDGLLEVLADHFALDVDNVVEVDFAGFARLVDLVGGIDVRTAAPVRDELSGLSIETPGCHRLAGDQALALARARRLQHHSDGRWTTDPTSDLGRIARQPALLTAGLQALTRTRPDPLTADRLAGWLADHAAVDDTLGNQELIALLGSVMTLSPDDVSYASIPVEPHTLDGGAVVLLPAADAEGVIESWRVGSASTSTTGQELIAPCPG